MQQRRLFIDRKHKVLSIVKQCDLLGIHRSGVYYTPCDESVMNLELMRKIDEHFLKHPFKGVPRMTAWLRSMGYQVNKKRIRRLYQLMGIEAIYPKPNLSKADLKAYKYPYLLKNMLVAKPNQVWAVDITYVPVNNGYLYLFAVIDLYSRYVVAWSISNTMTSEWVCATLKEAIEVYGSPEVINSDQGSQFTSENWKSACDGIQISMDGKGRATDNIFIERLWRSVKYENIYLHDYSGGVELYKGLREYFHFYNNERHHQSLNYMTPKQIYYKAA